MSMERTISITCPGCGHSSDFVIWQSINTVMNPDMKQAVRDGSAFAFTCPIASRPGTWIMASSITRWMTRS